MKPIYILWDDANTNHGWTEASEVAEEKLSTVRTLGFLVSEGELSFTVSLCWSEDSVNGWVIIPKAWIREIRYLPEEILL